MLKIYYYPRIDDYVFKEHYYFWALSNSGKIWYLLNYSESMELVAEVGD